MTTREELDEFFREEGLVDEDDEEDLTAQQVLKILQEAWSNELLSPELLPHKAEYVEVMMEQVEQMENNVKALSGTDLRSLIHRHELERIRYILRSYLRTRLKKIETFALWLLRTNPPGLLSPQEEKFMRDYVTHTAGHLQSMVAGLPSSAGRLNAKQLEEEPFLETHVFVRCLVNIDENIVITSDEEARLRKGSQHILPYSAVSHLVKNSQVILI